MEMGDQLHAPTALPLRKGAPSTHWEGSWTGARAVLDAVSSLPGVEPWSSSS